MRKTSIRKQLRTGIALAIGLVLALLFVPASELQMSQPGESGQWGEQVHEWLGGWVRVSRQTRHARSGQLVEQSPWQVTFQPRLRPLLYLAVLSGLLAIYSLIGREWPLQSLCHWRNYLALATRPLVRGVLVGGLAFLVMGLIGPRPVVHEWRSPDASLLASAERALAEFAAARALPARVERDVDADGMFLLRLRQYRHIAAIVGRDDWLPQVPELHQTRLSVRLPAPPLAFWLAGMIGLLVFGRSYRLALGGAGPVNGPLTGSPART
jgi:hypothetical protein